MKSKLLKLMLILGIVSVIFTLPQIADAATEGDYTYSVSNGEARITGFPTEISGAITIPDTLGGYPVTSIGSNAFYNCSSLISITIPDGVTSIGSNAFYKCSSLTNITIPDGVTSIGEDAFYNTGYIKDKTNWTNGILYIGNHLIDAETSLSGEIIIREGTKTIGPSAFYNCSSLTNITIPDSVTSIGYQAFYKCSSLTNITIPDGVTSIGYQAFYNCSSLTSIIIPDSVTSIGDGAFRGCSSLTSITLPFVGSSRNANETYDAVFGYIFGYTSSSTSGTTRQYYEPGSSRYYYIPSSLKEVIITDETQIPYGAFYNCSNLTNITIPDGVTSIGLYAFNYCSSLTSITIPDSVTSIGSNAFYNCSSLISITIPDSVTSIGSNAFYNCSSLISITIPDGVTSIGSNAFYNCSSLTNITIPDSVTSIGSSAFRGCSSLTSITIPDGVTSIGEDAFYNCSSLDKVYISDVGAYLNCEYGDTESVPMYYADKLYLNGKRVVSLTIPDTVTQIPSYAFEGCDSLRRVIIPNSVTSIGSDAFKGCTSIESITVPFVGSSREASGTSDAVFGYLFGYSTSSATGTTCQYFSASGSNYYYIPSGLKTVIITDTEQIPYGAFYGCNKLTDIQLADNVKTIGEKAFYNCDGITEFVITKNVSATGQQAFYSCGSLERVVIPRSLTEIEVNAFEACNSITTVDYQGSEDEWWEMYIGSGNDAIEDASVTCNYGMPVSITYASNGGANAPANQQAEENSDYTVSSVIPERSGYTFLGWADSPDSDAALYAPGDVIKTGTENITLYAVWKKHISISTEIINNTFVITPVGLENGNSIVLACYCGDKMVYADVFSYAGSSVVPFFVSAEYDTVKVMALESMSSIRPICKSDTAVSPANEISLLMIE